MRRFAIFATTLAILVLIGSQPWGATRPKKSLCVCLPSRAGLILRSMTSVSAITTTQAQPKGRFTDTALAAQ